MSLLDTVLSKALNSDPEERDAALKLVNAQTSTATAKAAASLSDTVATIEKRLLKAIENNSPQSVIDAYERLLVTASTNQG